MIHLMELPNPDPLTGRPDHGGRDRHTCWGVASVAPIADALRREGVPFTMSKRVKRPAARTTRRTARRVVVSAARYARFGRSGRAAIFFRDPDANTLECVELPPWR